jgi:hypothetical protein
VTANDLGAADNGIHGRSLLAGLGSGYGNGTGRFDKHHVTRQQTDRSAQASPGGEVEVPRQQLLVAALNAGQFALGNRREIIAGF